MTEIGIKAILYKTYLLAAGSMMASRVGVP